MLNLLKRPQSIRPKLLMLVLGPMLLMAAMLIALLYFWTHQVSYRQLLMKASTDLAVVNQSFQNTQEYYFSQLVIATQRQHLTGYIQNPRTVIHPSSYPKAATKAELQKKLLQIKDQANLSFIQLLAPNHCPILNTAPCQRFESELVARASRGEGGSGVEIFNVTQLAKLSAPLAERAKVSIKSTEQALEVQKTVEDRAMILHFTYPLFDAEGAVIAILSGGVLMNNNNTFVDQIKQTVYGEGSLHSQSLGTVTIFLDDVRISTNVPDAAQISGRAIGTRVSEQVRQKVLLQGERWLDRAFVVDDWYISGYLPITDSHGMRVGMIYAGFLEAPFRQEFYHWLWQLLVLVIIVLISCAFIVIRGAKSIFDPVTTMVGVMTAIRCGQRQRIKLSSNTAPELQTLAQQFNLMLNQLEEQHDHIEHSAELLEVKVSARTKKLNQHIKLLQRTREQLVAKEKLAVIGQLTAGIAHEINNPATVILGYLDVLMNELDECGIDAQADIEIMVQQVERIRSLINDLLLLSNPNIDVLPGRPIDINELVKATNILVKHDLFAKNLSLVFDLRATSAVLGSRQKLQQVLINLLVNAIAASDDFAQIKIQTRHWRNAVILLVTDTGCGMSAAILERIFDPFYSHTRGGTGLGLSISYSLLQSQGAQISVHSTPSSGSTFCLWLPLA